MSIIISDTDNTLVVEIKDLLKHDSVIECIDKTAEAIRLKLGDVGLVVKRNGKINNVITNYLNN